MTIAEIIGAILGLIVMAAVLVWITVGLAMWVWSIVRLLLEHK